MFGAPDKIEGNCNARLYLSDDYGDNTCTCQCPLNPNHEGPHTEAFIRDGKEVKITWWIDEGEEE